MELVRIAEAARRLGISRQAFYAWLARHPEVTRLTVMGVQCVDWSQIKSARMLTGDNV